MQRTIAIMLIGVFLLFNIAFAITDTVVNEKLSPPLSLQQGDAETVNLSGTLAGQSVFNSIVDAIDKEGGKSVFNSIVDAIDKEGGITQYEYDKRIEIEISFIFKMALKGMKENAAEYTSRLNINSALDKQFGERTHQLQGIKNRKLLEVTTNPKTTQDGAIEISAKVKGPGETQREFRIVFSGSKLEEVYDRTKFEVAPKVAPPLDLAYPIPHPIEIFSEDTTQISDLSNRGHVTSQLEDNVYYTNAPESRKEQIISRISDLAPVAEYVRKYMARNHPSLKVKNINVVGSYLFGHEEIEPDDIDLTIIVEGNHFKDWDIYLDDTYQDIEDNTFPYKELKKLLNRKARALSITILGEENLVRGVADTRSKLAEHVDMQRDFIDRRVPFLTDRFVLFGNNFRNNEDVRKYSMLRLLSRMNLIAYWGIYEHFFDRSISPHRHIRKALIRLYDVCLGLRELDPGINLDPEEVFQLSYKWKRGEVSLAEIEKLRIRINEHFEKLCSEMIYTKPDQISIPEELNLINAVANPDVLGMSPVDITVGLSLIPEGDLDANMEDWAYIIALNNSYGLDVNYLFQSSDKKYELKARQILLAKIKDLSREKRINEDEIRTRVVSTPRSNAIKVNIMKAEDLKKLSELPEGMLPIAMADDTARQGSPLRNFIAASSIGLAQAACKKAQIYDDKHPDEGNTLPEVVKEVLPRIQRVYKKILPKEIITKETVFNMVHNNPTVRRNLAISLAIPPIVKLAIEELRKYHEKLQDILSAA